MNPIQVLLLQWQDVVLSTEQAWELIGLNETQIQDYLWAQNIKIKPDTFSQLKNDYKICVENGLTIVPFWHPHYPQDILSMTKPPWVLTCIGDSSQLVNHSIGVVGSRKLSYETSAWMDSELSQFLANGPYNFVSGGAYGVDQKAHQICVLNNRPSICWLPSGLLEIYPQKLKDMSRDILGAGGVLVSTYKPKQCIRRHHFYQRNQFIAASSLFTFIVQAKRKSGTLITAKAAADMGKTVAVLPSSPKQEGLGGLDLLYDGAQLIRNSEDLMDLAQSLVVEKASPLMQSKG